MTTYVWVARSDNKLLLRSENNTDGYLTIYNKNSGYGKDIFPEVTHENSPKKYALVDAEVLKRVIETLEYYSESENIEIHYEPLRYIVLDWGEKAQEVLNKLRGEKK